jgi:Tfp pilus assembly protein PilF
VPSDDREVLERVPALGAGAGAAKASTGGGTPTDPRARELDALRRRLDADPKNLALAVELAQLDIEESRARADPRYLGRAEAALAPWWNERDAPPKVLLLRATIRQSLHDFEGALADLDRLVVLDPEDGQAWLTRAVVLTVRGRYTEARESCAPLVRLAGPLVTTACTAPIESLTGHAKDAYLALHDAYTKAAPTIATDGERAWVLSILGEIAARAGDDTAAVRDFETALRASSGDAYTKAALADLLLDLGRAADVARLLDGHLDDDNLLLRLVIAEAALGKPSAVEHEALLASRYAASEERGDVVHRREQARFALAVRHDAKKALTLARANWEVQKEPADARVLLEAAIAAGDPAAARPVADFLSASHAEEPRLLALAAKIPK